jgi:deoxyribonuclease-4
MYVHSQYIINLCQEGSYHTKLLEKNLFYASNAGFKGVVVHVGKSTIQEKETAISIMRTNLEQALSAATPECPILLETPAGQGTETLTDMIEFIDFVASFQDNRIRICVDTCHVFASGTNPYKYISTVQERDPTLLKLVHFNDSCTPCGSCVDRHAFVGTGYIGMEDMYKVGTFCDTLHIPMVVE